MTSRMSKLPSHSGMSSGGAYKGYLSKSGEVSDAAQKLPADPSPLPSHYALAGGEVPPSCEKWK